MAVIEKPLHKRVLAMFDLFVTPLVSVFVTGFVTMTVVGPIFNIVESGIINGVQALISIPLGIGSFLMGALYAPTVVAGIHHMYSVIDLGQIQEFGVTYWLPLASAANIAQGLLRSKHATGKSRPWRFRLPCRHSWELPNRRFSASTYAFSVRLSVHVSAEASARCLPQLRRSVQAERA